jgi:hypothetical protein
MPAPCRGILAAPILTSKLPFPCFADAITTSALASLLPLSRAMILWSITSALHGPQILGKGVVSELCK